MILGCHLSISDGFYAAALDALSIGANTFQFFSRNPRGSSVKELDLANIEKFRELADKNGIKKILAHAPYTMNPCSAREEIRSLALEMLREDLRRLAFIPDAMYNFHPGSHGGQGIEAGIKQTAEMLTNVLDETKTKILIETMAGKGTEIGGKFEELREIIDRTERSDLIGVCLDTCHVSDGGYDLNDIDGVLSEFDKVIGLDRLNAIHLNDSLNKIGSKKDRHAKIGEGNIGLSTIKALINHPKLKNLPFYLETPNELDGYAKEIELLTNG